ncbi:MAG: ABC transporter ATP-binding protein [Halanaerobiales bacterium]
MSKNRNLMEVKRLKKYFPIKKGIFHNVKDYVKAVDDISFFIRDGETLGLVGESGCGKSTTGRCIVNLYKPTEGHVLFRKKDELFDISKVDKHRLKELRKDIQMIFQDPFSSLDSRMLVRDIIAEPLRLHNIGNREERTEKVKELLERVGLRSYQLNRYPHEFSGGQRQRIGIARALALNPKLIICDEPVSALDVSVQAQVLNLLSDLQEEFGLTYLFIAHDLSVVEHISDRVIVMYLGKIVEIASSNNLYSSPKHPYTEALLKSIPIADPCSDVERIALKGGVPNPANPPQGCNFHTRCPYAEKKCREEEPSLVEINETKSHFVSCHFAHQLKLTGYLKL